MSAPYDRLVLAGLRPTEADAILTADRRRVGLSPRVRVVGST